MAAKSFKLFDDLTHCPHCECSAAEVDNDPNSIWTLPALRVAVRSDEGGKIEGAICSGCAAEITF